ncbi:Ferric-pseudobactin BN7/BN8 receptor precursor [compost metagenome]
MSLARPRLVERRLNHAVRVALISMALVSVSTLIPVSDAAANTLDAVAARSYNIAAGPLGRTLSTFAAQAGVALSFDPALTEGISSPTLSGTYSAREAIEKLLSGSGLEVVARTDGSYTLRKHSGATPRESSTLPEVNVTAAMGATTEGSGSYTTGSASTATRLNMSLRETPQSVSVITRQRMDDQGLTQLTDLVAQTPGLTLNATGNLGSDSSSIFARGFAVENYQTDGVGQVYSGYNAIFQTNDLAIYDRVEVVRGATGLMNGVGTPSATINMMRKRPTAQFQGSAKVEVGSWNYRRVEADLSAPLNEAGTVRGRVVAAYQDNDSFIDRLHEKKKIFYGIVEADIAPATLLTAGLTIQHHDTDGHARGGRPAYYSDGTRAVWGRNESAAAAWTYSNRHSESLFASIEHQFDNEWKFKGTLSRATTKYDEVLGGNNGTPVRGNGAGMRVMAGHWVGDPQQDSLDLYATGPFSMFGRKHELVVGATVAQTNGNIPSFGRWHYANIPDYYSWNGVTPAAPVMAQTAAGTDKEKTHGAYATARFKPTDALSLIVGARVTSWARSTTTLDFASNTSTATYASANNEVTPYAGLVYDINQNWSAYASYTNIFKPQTARDINDRIVDPLLGNSYEIGAKGEFFNKRLNVAGSIFQIEQDNLTVPYVPSIPSAIDLSSLVQVVSGTKTRGYEVEASGQLARNWQGSASYTRSMTKDRNGIPLNTNIPQNTFKLFTTYSMPHLGNGLTVGGGVRWQSEIYNTTTQAGRPTTFKQGGYALVDLMARYSITKQLTATFNLYNLFDKYYYTSTGSAYYGAPRNVRVGLDMRF